MPPRKQCKKCPWKVGTNPDEIPHGYSRTLHAGLKGTVANPGEVSAKPLRVMACHKTPIGKELPCVGWIHNQMGVGNNIGLRVKVAIGEINGDVEIVGEQHQTFEDTLPKDFHNDRLS